MVQIAIPHSQKRPLKLLLRLSAAERSALLDRLEETGPALVTGKPEFALAEATGLEEDAALDVLYMLMSLFQANQKRVLTPESLVDALGEDGDLQPELADPEDLVAFFSRLFGLKSSLGVVSKAYRLAAEHAHSFCTADIVTDLRPIFDDVEEDPVAAAVVHTLRLAYHKARGLEEIFIGLDSAHLRKLADIAARALNKGASLEKLAKRVELPLLATED